MKYIRTKDKIYEVVREICEGEAYEVKVPQSEWWYDEDNKCYYEDSKFDSFHKKEVITEADTIEELCDMFVIINEDWGKEPYCCTNVELKLYKKLKTEGEIYGAIWTDKGLIFVAKMNKEGDLELL